MMMPRGMRRLVGRLGMGGGVGCSLVVAGIGVRLGRGRPLRKGGRKIRLERRWCWRCGFGLWLRLGGGFALRSGLGLMGLRRMVIEGRLSTFCGLLV